jgi:hypothetical protein
MLKLFQFCKSLYGGTKIQNHGFNNRVNSEFKNRTGVKNDLFQIVGSKYFIHSTFLYIEKNEISK